MRVAVIDPSNFTIPYDIALCRGLADRGHAVTMVGRSPAEPDGGDAAWPEPRVPFVPLFYPGVERLRALPRPVFLGVKGLSHLAGMAALRRRLAALRPDIIHVQWFPFPLADRLMLPALKAVAPVVLTMHDTEPFNGNPTSALQRLGALDLPRRCDRVIVHTTLGARRLEAMGVPAARITIVPHGLLGNPPPESAPPDGPTTFLVVGKIKHYKGIDVFVEAIARMPEGVRRGCRFVVAGQPYIDMAPIVAAARRHRLDELTFDLRFLSDAEMADAMRQAGVLVFPYREIEASGVLALALGHGRAILASRVGGFAETLSDGDSARLVPPGDSAALAAAMTELATRPGERAWLGTAARWLARRMQDWGTIAERTTAVYAAARQDRDNGGGLAVQPVRS